MCTSFKLVPTLTILLLIATPLRAQDSPRDKVEYEKRYRDPALEEMKAENRKAEDKRTAEMEKIRDRQEKAADKREKEERRIRYDLSDLPKPASPEAFQSAFHFPPVRQYLTGTCWCFSTTSYFESEVYRLTGRRIKLSEMFTVYYEYLEEARRYIRERGDSFFDEGSEGNTVILVCHQYGVASPEGGAPDPTASKASP